MQPRSIINWNGKRTKYVVVDTVTKQYYEKPLNVNGFISTSRINCIYKMQMAIGMQQMKNNNIIYFDGRYAVTTMTALEPNTNYFDKRRCSRQFCGSNKWRRYLYR
ncbi:MAG: hypothetical protein IPI65_17190 [Bacteroidetes bacterium]|nr:hypothetical protein [Bacteroidota bacterium]